jgi:hypothetical protein
MCSGKYLGRRNICLGWQILHKNKLHNFCYRCTVHLDVTKVFHSPTDAILLILESSKIYIKTYIKIAPTCFGLRPSSWSLHLSLAKVTLMLKQSVKLRSYVFRGGVAAFYVQVWCVCVCCVLCRAQHTAHTDFFNISVNLARLKCKLLDDGRRPKHVGATLI